MSEYIYIYKVCILYIKLAFQYYLLCQYFSLHISCTLLWGASFDGRLRFVASRHLANLVIVIVFVVSE